MSDDDDEQEKRRRREDAEEERRYWESIEDDHRAQEEIEAERRTTAIEAMELWFFEQFEDPQRETPRDSDDQTYIYPWGGPFDASEMLHAQFDHEYDKNLIASAVEQIERDGTIEWAPTSTGDYYEHPEPEPDEPTGVNDQVELTGRILARLEQLEAVIVALPGQPGNIGHNAPPEVIGLPPYDEGYATEVRTAIAETRSALTATEPNAAHLSALSQRFAGWGRKLGVWLAEKGDLAVDELIKSGVKAVTWGSAFTLFSELADDLFALAKYFRDIF